MKKIILSSVSYLFKCLLYGAIGAALLALVMVVRLLNDKPDLEIWHTAELNEEYTAESKVATFADYLALEDRLFTQLDELVVTPKSNDPAKWANRYSNQSYADATSWESNWNRSFEFVHEAPKCGVLLLHGLTDAPYSLRRLGQRLHAEGAYVVGLRIPGHGTAPAALRQASWQDMTAAVRLAMRHLKSVVDEQPLHAVGYSHGGALSIRYALDCLADQSLPVLENMVLVSPEIGITSLAKFAIWQKRFSYLLGMAKLQWHIIAPEYDPYKYHSLPVNAAAVAYQLTILNREELRKLEGDSRLKSFPRVLAFQSVVDTTVEMPALVRDFLRRLPEAGHELVLYDINRNSQVEPLFIQGKVPHLESLVSDPQRDYKLSVVRNESSATQSVAVHSYAPSLHEPEVLALGYEWPATVYSLSHIALPFHRDDPLYGAGPQKNPERIHLGAIAVRGEKGVFAVAAGDMLRQRWNPFYDYQEARIVEHLK